MRYNFKLKSARELTRQQAEALDRNSDGRRQRITGPELDALIRFHAGFVLMAEAVESGDLARIIKRAEARMLPQAIGLIQKARTQMDGAISANQLRSLDANISHNARITVSTDGAPPMYTAIRQEHLLALCRAVTADHCGLMCTKDREKAKRCPVREALDAVPGLAGWKDKTDPKCPWALAGGIGTEETA